MNDPEFHEHWYCYWTQVLAYNMVLRPQDWLYTCDARYSAEWMQTKRPLTFGCFLTADRRPNMFRLPNGALALAGELETHKSMGYQHDARVFLVEDRLKPWRCSFRALRFIHDCEDIERLVASHPKRALVPAPHDPSAYWKDRAFRAQLRKTAFLTLRAWDAKRLKPHQPGSL